jgi:hypothetical protein
MTLYLRSIGRVAGWRGGLGFLFYEECNDRNFDINPDALKFPTTASTKTVMILMIFPSQHQACCPVLFRLIPILGVNKVVGGVAQGQ